MHNALARRRLRVTTIAIAAALIGLLLGPSVDAQVRARLNPNEVRFNLPPAEQAPNPFLAGGVGVGQNVGLYFSAGIGPAARNTAAPAGTPERFIDPVQYPGGVLPGGVSITEAQGMNTMARIQENLESQGLSLADVISMRIYLEAPPGETRADYAGWNRAYRKWMANVDRQTGEVIPAYAPVEFANVVRPARTNLEVATLPVAGWLVEIEVIASYPHPGR